MSQLKPNEVKALSIPFAAVRINYRPNFPMPPAWIEGAKYIIEQINQGSANGAAMAFNLGWMLYYRPTPNDQINHPIFVNVVEVWMHLANKPSEPETSSPSKGPGAYDASDNYYQNYYD